MGHRYKTWISRTSDFPQTSLEIEKKLKDRFQLDSDISLNYGDHGLSRVKETILSGIKANKKIALFADYDVDGTMSCVSWVWFFQSISYTNYTYYIPDRFKEGYGLNLEAIKKLVKEEGAEIIITMDCGITANVEAHWCKENNVQFICTDHHKINPANMPDCLILNPVLHPDPSYRFLCGCAVTYVLLRQLAKDFPCSEALWYDLLALAGLATICDVVPLNSVNHKIAKLGIRALSRSKRPVIVKLLKESLDNKGEGLDEQDLGFKIGPRINAVGRLDHGHKIVNAFIGDDPDSLVRYMAECNDERKRIQDGIWKEAYFLAKDQEDSPIIFVGGAWHAGVIGIVASRLAENFWKPVWIYSTKQAPFLKGSVRSIPNFDVTSAMISCGEKFTKYGGHAAAAGFTFEEKNKNSIFASLKAYALQKKQENEKLWLSSITYDFSLESSFLNHNLLESIDRLKPFGHGFPEPIFKIKGTVSQSTFYSDKVTGERKHTCLFIKDTYLKPFKVLFFNNVYDGFSLGKEVELLVTVQKNYWRSRISLSLIGIDFNFLNTGESQTYIKG